jgi:hypothetical protein
MVPNVLTKIAFLLDCTGSMEPWIQEAKTKIQDILRDVRKEHPHAEFEVALIAYRDYGDQVRFRVVDFTNANEIVRALEPIHAKGGDDDTEDVAGALDKACDLTWGPSDVRLLFHIADAPAHGMKYHEPHVSDRFPQGDPEGKKPTRLLTHLAHQEIEYTFVRITASTDKMLGVFHRVYEEEGGRFRVIDLHPQSYDGRYGRVVDGNMATVLSPAVSRAVSQAVTRYTASQDIEHS